MTDGKLPNPPKQAVLFLGGSVKMPLDMTKKPYIYGKGSLDFTFYNPETHDVVFYTDKLQAGNFNSSLNMNPIQAGPGNAPVIFIPDGQTITLELTAADVSLVARGLNAGTAPRYGGVVKKKTAIPVVGGKIQLIDTAVPQLGNNTGVPYAWIDGKAYRVDSQGYLLDFVGTDGQALCVDYYTIDPSAMQLDYNSLFSPMIGIAEIRQPLFATDGNDVNAGSRIGEDVYTIPRFQFSGSVSTSFEQTSPATTSLTGSALSFSEGAEKQAQGAVCNMGMPKLAYVVRRIDKLNVYENVDGLVVVGGLVTVPDGGDRRIPLKLAMNNGQLMQPDYSDFDYVSDAPAVATVDSSGIVTAVSVGACKVKITHKTIGSLELSVDVFVV